METNQNRKHADSLLPTRITLAKKELQFAEDVIDAMDYCRKEKLHLARTELERDQLLSKIDELEDLAIQRHNVVKEEISQLEAQKEAISDA